MRNLLIILLAIATLLVVQISFADEQSSISSDSATFSYTLPYPGILPDSPLYFLKTIRDRIEGFLISDPLIKASFDLRSADKRLASAIALFDKNKKELAETTVSKGENYFEDGLKNTLMAKREGRSLDPSLLTSMELSAKKHKEVLEGMIKKSSGSLKEKLSADLKRAESFFAQVQSLKSQ